MGNVFRNFNRTKNPICKTKDRLPMPFVQFQKCRLVAVSCPFEQKFICSSFRQSSTRSCRNRFLLLLPKPGQKLLSGPKISFIGADSNAAEGGLYITLFRLAAGR